MTSQVRVVCEKHGVQNSNGGRCEQCVLNKLKLAGSVVTIANRTTAKQSYKPNRRADDVSLPVLTMSGIAKFVVVFGVLLLLAAAVVRATE